MGRVEKRGSTGAGSSLVVEECFRLVDMVERGESSKRVEEGEKERELSWLKDQKSLEIADQIARFQLLKQRGFVYSVAIPHFHFNSRSPVLLLLHSTTLPLPALPTMGVPALFRWLSKKYPKIVLPVSHHHPPATLFAPTPPTDETPLPSRLLPNRRSLKILPSPFQEKMVSWKRL